MAVEKALTETRYTRHTLTDAETLAISRTMARAESIIREKEDELKSYSSTVKGDIAVQEGIIHNCAEKIRSGYEMKQQECLVKYDTVNKLVKYLFPETGEVLEERPMTDTEQLKLCGIETTEEEHIEFTPDGENPDDEDNPSN